MVSGVGGEGHTWVSEHFAPRGPEGDPDWTRPDPMRGPSQGYMERQAIAGFQPLLSFRTVIPVDLDSL